jgi:hypothetical protein
LFEHPDGSFEDLDPLRLRDAEHRVLVGPVADADGDLDAPTADEIEHGEVLGDPQWVVQHGDERREVDGHARGAAHDR